ncbi:MAG: ribonuclease H-like domain-containing protein, partial [Acidobacteria bacterium]|nr:ribonuclease H-like domain-containing protein [Acidobacteriota bacterium]
MDPAKLTSRLRDILRDQPGRVVPVERPAPGRRLPSFEAAASVLGASRWTVDGADCLVVEREYPADLRYGVMPIGEYAEASARAIRGLDLLGGDTGDLLADADSPRETLGRQLFFDLETTGLAGGAGTYAFLVGFGYFQGTTFQTRQFFLADYADERYLLRAVSEFVERARGLVTFNGRTFDLPLIATRYSMQRLRSPFEELPHVDMLHPARRLWRRRRQASSDRSGWPDPAGTGGGEYASCALGALERAILDVARVGDVPGAEIPARYFDYIRRGDATPLVDVFEHNRLDLLSLAALTSIVLTMIEGGAEATHNPRECLALGRLFEQT